MNPSGGEDVNQASVTTESSHTVVDPNSGVYSHGSGRDSPVAVLVELLRRVSPLRSEGPQDILQFFAQIEEVFELGLVEDRIFLTRILPLASGSVLCFLGNCLREGRGWAECKGLLLEEFFPYFVRERLLRDLIVFNFHKEGKPLRDYIDRVFRSASFLGYGASDQQLVDRVVMNFHPSILAHAALL
jgi:hypothetical protein